MFAQKDSWLHWEATQQGNMHVPGHLLGEGQEQGLVLHALHELVRVRVNDLRTSHHLRSNRLMADGSLLVSPALT